MRGYYVNNYVGTSFSLYTMRGKPCTARNTCTNVCHDATVEHSSTKVLMTINILIIRRTVCVCVCYRSHRVHSICAMIASRSRVGSRRLLFARRMRLEKCRECKNGKEMRHLARRQTRVNFDVVNVNPRAPLGRTVKIAREVKQRNGPSR